MLEVRIFVLLLVVCCQLLAASREKGPMLPEAPDGVLSKSNLIHAVKSFTSYHIYFQNTHSPFLDAVCLRYVSVNESSRLLEESVHSCPDPTFRLRQVSRSQITWKHNNHANKTNGHKEKGNSSETNTTQPVEENKSNATDKVHPFLVFALLLPEHPFSRDVKHWLKVIAPMYPSITIIVGNAYEFKDVSSKYLVHNFPKILLFKNGIYVGDYGETYDAPSIASYFTLWTKQLPKTIPLVVPRPSELPSVAFLKLPQSALDILQGLDVSFLERIPIPNPNLEPFIGTLENFQFWDRLFFLLCGVYMFARISQMYL